MMATKQKEAEEETEDKRREIEIDEEKLGKQSEIIFETYDDEEMKNMYSMDYKWNIGNHYNQSKEKFEEFIDNIKRVVIYGDGAIFYEEKINEDTKPASYLEIDDKESVERQIKEMLKENRMED